MRKTSLVTLILLLCCVARLALPAKAQQLINLNFSATAYTTPAANETSPATPSGPAGTWNNLTNNTLNAADSVETDETTVPVLLSNGSNGPKLTFDASGGTSSSNAWSGGVAFQTRDFTTEAGVYNVPSLYEAGLVNDSNARTTGFRIKGLNPGNYEVFVVPFYRSEVQAGAKVDTSKIYIGLGNDTDLRNAGNYTLTSTAASPTVNIDTTLATWVNATDGSAAYNYIGATVAIDSTSRWLTFLFEPPAVTTGGDRPAASVIQLRSTTAPGELLGDYNQNNRVDAADYVLWRKNEYTTNDLPNDGPLHGTMIGDAHYAQWRSHFGNGTGGNSAEMLAINTVPEPNTLLVAILVAATLWGRGRSRIH